MARQPVSIVGVSLVKKNMQKFEEQLLANFGRDLRGLADKIVLRAKNEFVPVKTGALRGTIRVERGQRLSASGKTVTIPIIAGGQSSISPTGSVDYANRIHEEHPTGRKFIQRPLFEEAAKLGKLFRRSFSRIQRF